MIRTCCFVLFAGYSFLAAAFADEPNRLSDIEKKSGWQLLFDGESLAGWRGYRKETAPEGWRIDEGAITRIGAGGDLITRQKYGSFELSFEYNVEQGGNSGLIFLVTEEFDSSYESGPEMQIMDAASDAKPIHVSGAIYDLYPSRRNPTRPAGEWNHVRMLVTSGKCHTILNGMVCNRYVIGDEKWNKRVTSSKFAAFPNFAKANEGHLCLQDHGSRVAFRNMKIREFPSEDTVYDPVDGTLALKPVLAFPKLKWANWEPVDEDGLARAFRPVLITHAGDGSNRLFVATQRGVVHVFENREDVESTQVFLDISDQTFYQDKQFERGLVGMAFHPNFAQNGEFFVCYMTPGEVPFQSIVSRFRVDSSNPNRADPNSEEVLIRLQQPYWNHDGGTVIFGPDGYLYIAFGDGGAGGDPQEFGQSLNTLLGKVLRIDVDRREGKLPYGIPGDNPFVGQEDTRGEIWAYGLRNVWRMAFDRATGMLWGADVGQDLFEEINILKPGGNYGWNYREGMHPFGLKGTGPREEFIEPIWEYDHSVGKSITGGLVYRGSKLPELVGHYVYGDFVSGRFWALKFDETSEQVVGNFKIAAPTLPVTSFGEDEAGELYFTVVDPNGDGVYRFAEK